MNYIDYTSERIKSGELEMQEKPLYKINGAAPKPKRDWLAVACYVVMIAVTVAAYVGLVYREVL
jgi:hypothetical protein